MDMYFVFLQRCEALVVHIKYMKPEWCSSNEVHPSHDFHQWCTLNDAHNSTTDAGICWLAVPYSILCCSIEMLRMGLLATACRVPGFSTILCNLCISTGEFKSAKTAWVDQYCEGYSQEVYTGIPVPEGFTGWRFDQVK